MIAKQSSRVPSPLIAETTNHGPFQASFFTIALARLSRSSGSRRSALLRTSQRGFL